MNTSEFQSELVDDVSRHSEIDAIVLVRTTFPIAKNGPGEWNIVLVSESPLSMEPLMSPFFTNSLVRESKTAWDDSTFYVEHPSGQILHLAWRRWTDWEIKLAQVAGRQEGSCGWTTVLWHQLVEGTILFDRQGRAKQLKSQYSIPYPQKLSQAILSKNIPLVLGSRSLIRLNLSAALSGNDWVSVAFHLGAFLASLFDIIFAANHTLQPGVQDLFAASCQLNGLPPDWKTLMEGVKNCPMGSPEVLKAVVQLSDAVESWLGEKDLKARQVPTAISPAVPDSQIVTSSVGPLVVYTDGGCIGNPGKGAWAYVIQDGAKQSESTGGERLTTNNKMELQAVISALTAIARTPGWQGRPVKVVTDSQYVRNGITTWIKSWSSNGWKTAAKEPVKNQELWKELQHWDKQVAPQWTWVKGHAGNPGNERCDDMVRLTMESLG